MHWSWPNVVTLGRLGLLVPIVGLLWPGICTASTAKWAAVLYGLAGVLDIVDGRLARHTNQVTSLGALLDPLADKLLYLVTLIALLQLPGNWVPGWVVMLTVVRELGITGVRGIASARGLVIAASDGGKLKTLLGTIGLCGLLVHEPLHLGLQFNRFHWTIDSYAFGIAFTLSSLLFSYISAIWYVQAFWQQLQSKSS